MLGPRHVIRAASVQVTIREGLLVQRERISAAQHLRVNFAGTLLVQTRRLDFLDQFPEPRRRQRARFYLGLAFVQFLDAFRRIGIAAVMGVTGKIDFLGAVVGDIPKPVFGFLPPARAIGSFLRIGC